MALYHLKFNVPAGTLETKPVEKKIEIKEKYIYEMGITFTDGSNWKVGVKIFYGIKRLWPENPDEWIWGNDETVPWREHLYLPEPKSILTIKAVSPEAVYSHEVIIRIKTLPDWVAAPGIILHKILKLFEEIF